METIKQYIYGALPLLTALPGLMAWLIEVVALVGSCDLHCNGYPPGVRACVMASDHSFSTRPAFIGIAMLTDRYVQLAGSVKGGWLTKSHVFTNRSA